jgi:glycosyltransferase involved in cell wall biosynthesis
MKDTLISIIVPVYKVERELKRCVDSLVNQTYKNIEIILVDDGSPDHCPQMCDEFAKEDNRIKVIHKENGGLSDARNAGLLYANGEYVLFVDSDDYIELDSCERFMAALNDEADFIVGECREVHTTYIKYQSHSNLQSEKVYNSRDYIIASIQKNEWFAPAWLNLYKKSFLLQNNLLYKKGVFFEDTEMLPRLCLAAEKIQYLKYPFYNYVLRDGSIMGSANFEKKRIDSLNIYSEWYQMFESIEDSEMQRYLYGALIKYYLKNCRAHKIKDWEIKNFDFKFAWKYSLNTKERLKTLLFSTLPGLYINL